jgi:uncharacterized protein YndB with AHSA1/START domain
VATLEALEQPRRAIVRGQPDGVLATTYSLEEENGGTRVTVTMSGFEALSEEARQHGLAPSSIGWEKALENLKAYVDGMELPFPQGYVAALFGYRREARHLLAVERSIWIAASRERVWRAITDPAQIEKWFSPGTAWALSALEVGGRLFVPNTETGEEMYTQVIETIEPPSRFVTRSVAEESKVSDMTTYALKEESGGTRLTLTYTVYEQTPDESSWATLEQHAFGFGMMLENLRASVEGTSLPYPGGF